MSLVVWLQVLTSTRNKAKKPKERVQVMTIRMLKILIGLTLILVSSCRSDKVAKAPVPQPTNAGAPRTDVQPEGAGNIPSIPGNGGSGQLESPLQHAAPQQPEPFDHLTASDWSAGEMAAYADYAVTVSSGQAVGLAKLQNSKPFLVIGFFNANCEHCQSKAEFLSHPASLDIVQKSSFCSFAAVAKGGAAAWSRFPEFYKNYIVEESPQHSNVLLETILFPQGLSYPATAIIDDKGNVIKRFQKDDGPQALFSYCKP